MECTGLRRRAVHRRSGCVSERAGDRAIALPNEPFEAAPRHLLVTDTAERVPGPVDSRSLGVREFGTVYEGLLESEIGVAETDLALDNKGVYRPARRRASVAVPAGETNPHNHSGARKDHYACRRAMDEADAADAFFDFWVADLATGSGPFVIAATDRIDKSIADATAARILSGVSRALDALRESAPAALGDAWRRYDVTPPA